MEERVITTERTIRAKRPSYEGVKMHCQIIDLDEDRTNGCKQDAVVRVTYPTGAIGDESYDLCLMHYTKCLREDVQHIDEFPDGWIQQVQYLAVTKDS